MTDAGRVELCDGRAVKDFNKESQALDAAAAGMIERLLIDAHARSRDRPIVGADGDGVFPAAYGIDVLGLTRRTPPVIPDTNLLSRDIGFSVRRSVRSVLVNAGNTGAVRLLCPAHVAAEIVSHSAKFSNQVGVDESQYLTAWHRDYLPLLRIVPELSLGMFTPAERSRIARLTELDYDDVPAAKLAIAAGGFFLSDDERALTAVYGTARTLARNTSGFTKWVDALKGWGNADELGKILEFGGLLTRLAGVGAAAVVRQSRSTPKTATALAIASLGGLAYTYRRATPEKRITIRSGASVAATYLLELVVQYAAAIAALGAHAAPQPTATELAATTTSDDRLARAFIKFLSRHPESIVTARMLSEMLPPRVAPRGEAKVRHVLRSYDCFTQPYGGWFQLGAPHAAMD